MVTRRFWLDRLAAAWSRRSVVWLVGARRVGKTCLARALSDSLYLDCELPSVRRQIQDPEAFLSAVRGRTLVFDEVHRLDNPSELLKIAADHFPELRVVATGSSTLGASERFRDTLAGRKEEVWLTPMTLADLSDFGTTDLERRLLRGGLPEFFLDEQLPEREYQEWLDAYWSKDVLGLFRLERRHAFQRLFELLVAQSGGIFEASALARPCEISRTTVSNYLAVLEATHAVHLVRPYAKGGAAEIVAAPKVYAFDTGFVSYFRGWRELRSEDLGTLWEHFVLNELHAHLEPRSVHYWRTKNGREVDFVVTHRGGSPTAVECKWSVDQFESTGMTAFRRAYPDGQDFVVARDVKEPFIRTIGGRPIRFVSLSDLVNALDTPRGLESPRHGSA
jgi:uncharacterized protein